MTKRQKVLEQIKINVAKEGKIDFVTTRLYIENRISKQAFNDAVAKGIAIYRKQ